MCGRSSKRFNNHDSVINEPLHSRFVKRIHLDLQTHTGIILLLEWHWRSLLSCSSIPHLLRQFETAAKKMHSHLSIFLGASYVRGFWTRFWTNRMRMIAACWKMNDSIGLAPFSFSLVQWPKLWIDAYDFLLFFNRTIHRIANLIDCFSIWTQITLDEPYETSISLSCLC